MLHEVPEDFQRKLDEFNDAQGGPSMIAIAWNQKKYRWQVFAIPVQGSTHPHATSDIRKMLRPLPDDSGRDGVLLFTWCERDLAGNDIGGCSLDDRIFHTLRYADSFQDRHHYENTIERPELRREAQASATLRDIAGAATEYWRSIDNPIINMNPHRTQPGDWRARQWWR